MSIYLVLFLSMILTNCKSKKQYIVNREDSLLEKKEQHCDPFFKSPLDTIISQYILDVDGSFFHKEWLYYSVFFFEEDTSHFFTIWAFTLFPDYVTECIDTSNYNFYLAKHLQRNVIVISKNDNELILPSKENIDLAHSEKEKKYGGDNYSGSWFFETYRITKEKDMYMIIKNDSIINNFLDCLQTMDDDIETQEY